MLHIFIISNDIRIEKLIEFFQPFFKTKIRRASDFDHGLQEVFENRPSVVFIQSTIGSVSGETVARHIKSLLGSGSPRIVFMGEEGAKGGRKTTWCDDWICITDSKQKLQSDFSKLLNDYYPLDWKEISREMEKSASRQPNAGAVSAAAQVAGKPSETACAEKQPVSDAIHAQGAPHVIATEETAGVSSFEVIPPAETELPFEIFPDESTLHHDFSPTDEFPQGKKRTSFTVRLGLLVLFLLILTGGWFLFRRIQENRTPVPAIQRPPANGAQKQATSAHPRPVRTSTVRGVPSFIHRDWRDSAYSASHPGWERYLSPEYDFRLFRDKDTVKALQVIARENGQIRGNYLASVLGEFGLTLPQSPGVVERKDGLQVERTSLGGKAELVVYRNEGDGRIKAFVLAFS
jgi:flagellar FliL protein